jgi:hypothetical protein
MVRTMRTTTWFLRVLGLSVLCLGTTVGAQSSSGSPSGPHLGEPQISQPSDGSVNWKGVGLGAGAVVSNLFYVPAKLTYGILGSIAGGAGYALTGGNKEVANTIWRSSLGGDYVLTPDMMTGKRPIYFSGPSAAGPMQSATAGSRSSPSNGLPTMAGPSPSAGGAGVGTSPAAHPIDSGAGPIGATGSAQPAPYAGANNPGSSSQGYNRRPASKRSSLTDTSIE